MDALRTDHIGFPMCPPTPEPTPAPIIGICPPTPEPTPVPSAGLDINPQAVITSTVAGIEFGTWTPTLLSDGTIDIVVRNAFYLRADQLVICTFDIILTSIFGGDNKSEIALGGLPHISIGSNSSSGSLYTSYFKTNSPDVSSISGTVKNNDTKVDLWCQVRNSAGLKRLTQLDININAVLIGTVVYMSSRN